MTQNIKSKKIRSNLGSINWAFLCCIAVGLLCSSFIFIAICVGMISLLSGTAFLWRTVLLGTAGLTALEVVLLFIVGVVGSFLDRQHNNEPL